MHISDVKSSLKHLEKIINIAEEAKTFSDT